MAGWGTALLAGVGGAAKGITEQKRFDQAEELKRQLAKQQADIREMLAKISDETKRRGQDLTDTQKAADRVSKDADRKTRADAAAANLERLWSKDTDTSALGWDRNRLTEQGQQQTGDLGWDRNRIAEELGFGRLATTERGQDIGATTARRGQDLTSSTAAAGRSTTERGQDLAAGTARAGQAAIGQRSRAGNVLDVLKLKAAAEKGATAFPTSSGAAQKPEDWAAEFDRLYNDPNALGGEGARAAAAAPVGPAPAAAPVPAPAPAAPPPAPTRAPLPVPVRPQATAAPAPAADPRAALATQMVTLAKQIPTMPPGPARESAKKQLAALRLQAEQLRTKPGQD